MDGWMDGWLGGWIDRWIEGLMCGCRAQVTILLIATTQYNSAGHSICFQPVRLIASCRRQFNALLQARGLASIMNTEMFYDVHYYLLCPFPWRNL